MGWWRSVYYVLGWHYPDRIEWCQRQKHLKFIAFKIYDVRADQSGRCEATKCSYESIGSHTEKKEKKPKTGLGYHK
jgi:hypothetical protein